MPAINVAKTDTFETQRQKINQIGDQIFNISQGGSDLSTGNLKLGDGTIPNPSLSFVSNNSLGIYKPNSGTLGFVSSSKKLLDLSEFGSVFYKDVIVRKNIIFDEGLSILNSGQLYDAGNYTNVPLVGGTGDGATVDVTVVAFDGVINSIGDGYLNGQYTGAALVGGSGSGATASFVVDELNGAITNSGSGYQPGAYSNIPVTGGTGSGAVATITITGTASIAGNITNAGSGYTDGVYGQIPLYNEPLQTFVLTSVANPNAGQPGEPNEIYAVDSVSKPTLNLVKGNTYRFDISDPSLANHPLYFTDVFNGFLDNTEYFPITVGTSGQPGAFVDFIIKSYAQDSQIKYACINHQNMGNIIYLTSGTVGNQGTGISADVEIVGGEIVDVSITNSGLDYDINDTLILDDFSYGGSGFLYTLNAPVYDSEVTSFSITNSGVGYQINDILSFSNTSVGGYGSGFQFTVNTNPGKVRDFEIVDYGSGYDVGDILSFSGGVTNVSTFLPGVVQNISTTLSTSSAQITIADTSLIKEGYTVFGGQGDVGQLAQGTTVLSIDSPTTLTLSANPTTSGSASLSFTPVSFLEIEVPDASNIVQGDLITKVSGVGELVPNTTVSSVNGNIITLSQQPTTPGSIVVNFSPLFGIGSTPFEYEIQTLGSVNSVLVNAPGNGYSDGDIFSVNPFDLVQSTEYIVKNIDVQEVSFTQTINQSSLSVGDTVKIPDGTIVTVVPANSPVIVAEANITYSNISASGGSGTGATFNVIRDGGGFPSVFINNGGLNYQTNDTLTINGSSVGGSDGADDITLTVGSVTLSNALEVLAIDVSGTDISSILIEYLDGFQLEAGDSVIFSSTGSTQYTVDSAGDFESKWIINDALVPNLTLYVGDTYTFNLDDTSNLNHSFSISEFEGGSKSPSLIENVTTTLSDSSKDITVADTTNILVGMSVTASGVGELDEDTFVETVNSSTSITLSKFPTVSGSSVLSFSGVEYSIGITKTQSLLSIKITETTPDTLYYYCSENGSNHDSESSLFGNISTFTISSNNPKQFGSGFSLESFEVDSEDVITNDVETGELTSLSITTTEFNTELATVSDTLTTPLAKITRIEELTSIFSSTSISLESTSLDLNSNFNIGSPIKLTIANSTGNLTTSGVIKTTNSFNSNDKLLISENIISSTSGNDVIITPPTGRVLKVNNNTALVIPVGNTDERPSSLLAQDGAIRFNTQTSQYEGYSATTSSWSSLGGVRDLDGNTYILAEESVGSNDNTLWFINDNINTVRFTPQYQEFVNVKKIRSVNTSAPDYENWTANTPVNAGDYLKYKNNIYLVVTSGTTASSGNEPTDSTGDPFANGSSTLQYFTTAVAPLTFEEISEVRVDPLGFTDLVVNANLRFSNNVISTDISDLLIRPNAGQKVTVDSNTSLVIPVGDNNSRGNAARGSIRFNTSILQYEGYDGSNWSSLGGVRDVDGNTYIIPETSPGANENILYFYNNNDNTLRVTTSQIELDTIDTFASVTSDAINFNAATLTFDSLATTLDNTSSTETFLFSTKENFDFGLSIGLTTDPLVRLTTDGEIFYNSGFGTGVYDGLRLLDGDLKQFELSDVKLVTFKTTLDKGTINQGAATLYDPSVHESAKVQIIAHNTTTGDKEFVEYSVIDNGTDIFYTDFGNIKTGEELISTEFDFNASSEVRVTFIANTNLTNGDQIDITVVSNIIKR